MGHGGPSGGGRTDEPREDAAENVCGRAAAEHGGRIHRKQGKARSAQRPREPNGLFPRIADSHTELSSPALGTLRSPCGCVLTERLEDSNAAKTNYLSEPDERKNCYARMKTSQRERAAETWKCFKTCGNPQKEFLRFNRFELSAKNPVSRRMARVLEFREFSRPLAPRARPTSRGGW